MASTIAGIIAGSSGMRKNSQATSAPTAGPVDTMIAAVTGLAWAMPMVNSGAKLPMPIAPSSQSRHIGTCTGVRRLPSRNSRNSSRIGAAKA